LPEAARFSNANAGRSVTIRRLGREKSRICEGKRGGPPTKKKKKGEEGKLQDGNRVYGTFKDKLPLLLRKKDGGLNHSSFELKAVQTYPRRYTKEAVQGGKGGVRRRHQGRKEIRRGVDPSTEFFQITHAEKRRGNKGLRITRSRHEIERGGTHHKKVR